MKESIEKEKKALKKQADSISLLKQNDLLGSSGELDIKPKQPSDFDGTPSKLRPFLNQCELVFALRSEKFATGKARLLYCLSFFNEGKASAWRDSALTNIDGLLMSISTAAIEKKMGTWQAMKILFTEIFNDVTLKAAAQQKLLHIKQGNRSVEEYITEFSLSGMDSGLEPEVCEIFFKNGLKEIIRSKIYETGNIPKNLNEWKDRAKAIDLGWREAQLAKRSDGNFSKARFVQQGSSSKQRLPDKEFQRRREEKACFKCGMKGHFIKDCKVKVNRVQGQIEEETSEEPKQDFT
jgi:hypothetical protein